MDTEVLSDRAHGTAIHERIDDRAVAVSPIAVDGIMLFPRLAPIMAMTLLHRWHFAEVS